VRKRIDTRRPRPPERSAGVSNLTRRNQGCRHERRRCSVDRSRRSPDSSPSRRAVHHSPIVAPAGPSPNATRRPRSGTLDTPKTVEAWTMRCLSICHQEAVAMPSEGARAVRASSASMMRQRYPRTQTPPRRPGARQHANAGPAPESSQTLVGPSCHGVVTTRAKLCGSGWYTLR
jgi:hypothetical protein